MFFSFIRDEAKSEKMRINKVSPGALEARGMAKMPTDKTDKQLLEEILVERYSEKNDTTKKKKIKATELTPGVKAISGIAKMPKGKTYRQVIEEAIIEKYFGIEE